MVTQVWIAQTDASSSRILTHAATDVTDFAWSPDGKSIVFSSTAGLIEARKAIEVEGLSGYHYDDRSVPDYGPTPLLSGRLPEQYDIIALSGGPARPATASERQALLPPIDYETTDRAVLKASGTNHHRAWTAPRDRNWTTTVDLWASDGAKPAIRCDADACRGTPSHGLLGLWWSADGHKVYFMRQEGWDLEETTLYAWAPGSEPERIVKTTDVVMGCQMVPAGLACVRESSTQPRQLVIINPENARSSPVFDPNPEFADVRLGTVQRLRFKNDAGMEAFGDLVLPPDYKPGVRLPLVIVQYRSKGFLRGGTGDEYPIQLFAARGFAVLSFQKPLAVFEVHPNPAWKTWQEAEVANQKNWSERRSKLSAILNGLKQAISLGVVDPARVGISGLSDGSTTVRFGMINAPGIFAAAAVSGCCFDGRSMMIYGGPAVAKERANMGFPPVGEDMSAWKAHSLPYNAARIETPLLIQSVDHDYLYALETVAMLRQEKKPVDLFVFPDEYHVKWQPAHRLAAYDRGLDWFDFWLRNREDPDPEKRAQYSRWEAMRAEWKGGVASSPAPAH